MEISVVVPVYGSPQSIIPLVERVEAQLKPIAGKHYEIILINDACPRGSWEVIKNLSVENENVVGLNLSRNFGQHYAILAGLEHTQGNWVIVMDCDLQDVPEEISKLYDKAQEGYDVVLASRAQREDSFFKKLGSNFFYKLLSYATDTRQNSKIANFGIYHRKVVNALIRFREQLRFLPVNVRWLGFKTYELDVKHARRDEGKSSYSLRKLMRLAFDIIFGFSNKPMGILITMGLVIAIVSILVALSFVVRYMMNDIVVPGWTGIMVSIWFMFGCILFSLGIIGLYIGKTFDETKGRPLYVIDEIISSRSNGKT